MSDQAIVADLQCHSFHSDGDPSPGELVRRAAEAGIRYLALTDHGTTAGWTEFLAECVAHRITPIRAAEFSCRCDAGWLDLLAYGVDVGNAAFQALLASYRTVLNDLVDRRLAWLSHQQAGPTAKTIRDYYGIPYDTRTWYWARKYQGEVFGYSAVALDAQTVAQGTAIGSQHSHYAETLPRVEDAVAAVHGAGGMLSIVHPQQSADVLFGKQGDPTEHVQRFLDTVAAPLVALGLDAIEASHWRHTPATVQQIRAWAQRKYPGLLLTGGSDYHGHLPGEHKPHIPFGRWGLTLEQFAPVAQRLGIALQTATP